MSSTILRSTDVSRKKKTSGIEHVCLLVRLVCLFAVGLSPHEIFARERKKPTTMTCFPLLQTSPADMQRSERFFLRSLHVPSLLATSSAVSLKIERGISPHPSLLLLLLLLSASFFNRCFSQFDWEHRQQSTSEKFDVSSECCHRHVTKKVCSRTTSLTRRDEITVEINKLDEERTREEEGERKMEKRFVHLSCFSLSKRFRKPHVAFFSFQIRRETCPHQIGSMLIKPRFPLDRFCLVLSSTLAQRAASTKSTKSTKSADGEAFLPLQGIWK